MTTPTNARIYIERAEILIGEILRSQKLLHVCTEVRSSPLNDGTFLLAVVVKYRKSISQKTGGEIVLETSSPLKSDSIYLFMKEKNYFPIKCFPWDRNRYEVLRMYTEDFLANFQVNFYLKR